jgi:outer membrane protein insertion porin family
LQVKGVLVTVVTVLALVAAADAEDSRRLLLMPLSASQELGQNSDSIPAPPLSAQGAISSYLGLIVHRIRFRGITSLSERHLQQQIPLRSGQPLDRDLVRESIQKLFASGRFADIQVEAERVADNQVDLFFLTSPNYFVGDVNVAGAPNRPAPNQIINASKLQLGEVYTQEKMDRAHSNIQQLLQTDGYYRATILDQEQGHPETQQIDITFEIKPGPQAHIGQVTVSGDPGYSQGQVQDIAHMQPGERVSADRVTKALQRLRKKYQKQERLLAQVSIAERKYNPTTNAVDYRFQIDRGPTVEIATEGFKIRRSVLKKNVPVYEEGAVDDDLLNEGRRNLLDYLQTRGYFDATIGIRKQSDSPRNTLRFLYTIDAGPRHKLVKVIINGNKYFDLELLRSHMQVQPASSRLTHGRFSQRTLNNDVRGLEDLYRASGFRQIQIKSTVDDNYQGVAARLAVVLDITEGPQTLVGSLQIVGNGTIASDQLTPLLNTAPGQPFSEYNIATDRDSVLNYYFNHGFPNAAFEAAFQPAKGKANRMDVTFTIHEGEQFFVNQVLTSGLVHTRPYIVNRELRVVPETPLSQQDMLDTQRRLYDLGIFNQVDTAVQNPDGTEPSKNALVAVHEAKRYTFDYGLGLEFQTSQPGIGANQPQGNTGVSPRVSFAVTRLNLRGRDQTVTFRTNVGSLQQRALLSFDAPKWLRPELRLSFTAFYDNTLDVTTFTSQRLESSAQIEQTMSKASTMIYRFTYRRVKASNIVVASDEIPLLSQPVRVGIPGFTYIRDKRDNPLETTRGNYTTIDGGAASSYFGSQADFGRILVQNATYQPFGKNRPPDKKYVFARSTRIGLEYPFRNTVIVNPGGTPSAGETLIPLAERFFSGGGNSHRGFGLNQAGPRDPTTGFPLGGTALFVNNLELRLPPPTLPYVGDNISFAIFHDAGNVFTAGHDMLHSFLNWRQPNVSACSQQSTASQCSYNYISQAVGVGVRYKTPIGPVRFDFGYNLNPPAFPSCALDSHGNCIPGSFVPQHLTHFNVFFSIGQTF